MKRLMTGGILVAAAALFWLATGRGQQPAEMKIPAPELAGADAWINSKPLQLKDLRGKVVVLHFWTFG